MSGSINNVEAVIVPKTGGSSGLNRNAALLLLIHEVSRGSTVVYLSGLVDLTGELEDTLGGCCFTGINVGEDPDISVFGEVFHLPV